MCRCVGPESKSEVSFLTASQWVRKPTEALGHWLHGAHELGQHRCLQGTDAHLPGEVELSAWIWFVWWGSWFSCSLLCGYLKVTKSTSYTRGLFWSQSNPQTCSKPETMGKKSCPSWKGWRYSAKKRPRLVLLFLCFVFGRLGCISDTFPVGWYNSEGQDLGQRWSLRECGIKWDLKRLLISFCF